MKKLLVFCIIVGFMFAFGNTAIAAQWDVPGDFATIQLAINSADVGDTIEVDEGIYAEQVWVNKELTIQAAFGATPIIDGGGSANGINVLADNVNITGLTVKNTLIAIGISGTVSNYIADNLLEDNKIGIGLYNANTNTIEGNTISSNEFQGIYTIGSSDNTINGNTMVNNQIGIQLDLASNDNSIADNTIEDNELGLKSNNNSNNSIEGNTIFSNTWQGILIETSSNNMITENTIENNWVGIYFCLASNDNAVEDNTVLLSSVMNIYVDASNGITISGNSISSGGWAGIQFLNGATGSAHFNNIFANSSWGLVNDTDAAIDATNNWWGHASGPSGPGGRLNKAGKEIGQGDAIFGPADWEPWLPQPINHTKHDPVPPGLM